MSHLTRMALLETACFSSVASYKLVRTVSRVTGMDTAEDKTGWGGEGRHSKTTLRLGTLTLISKVLRF